MQKVKYVLKHSHIKGDEIAKRKLLEVQKSDFYVVLNKLIDLNYVFTHINDKNCKSITVFTQGKLEYTEVCNLLNLCEVIK